MAEGRLVVSVENAAEDLNVERQEVGHPRGLDTFLGQPLLAEEHAVHIGAVDPGQIVLVNDVRPAEAIAHLAQLRLRAIRQRQQRDGRFGEAHAGRRARLFFPGLDPDVGTRVGVDLAEQAQLDLARKEAILAAGEGAGAGLLDVVLGDVADEIAGHAHVEEQLAAATLLVERERLPRAEQVGRRGRRHLRLWICGRWPGRARRRRRGHRRRLRLQPLQPLAQRVDGSLILLLLALELLELLAQRFGVLREDGRRAERDEERDNEDHECVH